jgi:hypothetical protein
MVDGKNGNGGVVVVVAGSAFIGGSGGETRGCAGIVE